MYKLIICFTDKQNFGNQIIVYGGDENYLVIEKDREDAALYVVDNATSKMYPVNTIMKQRKLVFDFNNIPTCIDCTIDVSQYGYSPCPPWLKMLIQQGKP